jgi:P-type Ca2+ transporter type 2C
VVRSLHTSVHGRARYHVEGLYRSECLKKHLEASLVQREGIINVSVNLLTGSILVFFNSDNTPLTIASLIRDIASGYQKKTVQEKNDTLPGKKKEGFKNNLPASLLKKNNLNQANRLSKKPATNRRKLRKLVVNAVDQKSENWHNLEAAEAVNFFETSAQYGLLPESVKANLKKYGPNVLPESVPRSGLSIFMEQFKSLPVALLGVAAGISAVTGGLADAAVIMGVVVINAIIGYTTETQAERTIHSLKNLVRPTANVLREGLLKTISVEEIAPGDILLLRPGSYITADARLLQTRQLSVDESVLTGESMPVTKSPHPISKVDCPLADRLNMVYMGTLVTGGQGIAVVVATGRFTEIGKIQALVGEAKTPETPMERQLDKMGSQLVIISGAVCGLVFIIGLIRGYGFLQMLKTSISLAVAAVPEGLPTVATTTLALGIRNMRRHNVLIRHLDAVETLGSVQTICLDKTGTITANKMTVVSFFTGMRRVTVEDGKFKSEGEDNDPYRADELLKLIHISILCNESEVFEQNGNYIVNGSPTENALINVALSRGINVVDLRNQFPTVTIHHRSENRNYMFTSHRTQNRNGSVVALKGSPDEVLSLCNWHLKDGNKLPLTDDDRLTIVTENERMAGDALRILGVAYSFQDDNTVLSEEYLSVKDDMIWIGLIGMKDPIRDRVSGLIEAFHDAGIDTVMITGDQTPTAYAIGKELNLSNGKQLEILDSTNLVNIDPEVMKALCARVHVFSRVSPAHKLQIVRALQHSGKIVAMTGDGINDGPALKAANIGIAMGHSGTDVAREVADVVIEDDNLETMIIAVSQGRTIYNNIRKSVHFLLSTNLSEIIVEFSAITAGLGQPLNAMQLLWINLISDIFPGLALALELPEPDVLTQPPRDPDEPIIKSSDFGRIAQESAVLSAGALGAYGYGIARYGMGPRAGTLAFMSLTYGQLLHSLSCRSEKFSLFDKGKMPRNKYLEIALGGSFAVQILAMVIPGIRNLLGITPISLLDGVVIGGSSFLPLIINEASKKQTASYRQYKLSQEMKVA